MGLVDPIYFAGEETGGDRTQVGGAFWALDVANGDLHALPAFGRGAWENATEVDTGTETHVAFMLTDDTAPFDADGDGITEGAPLYLYVGEKSADPAAGFLARNGLAGGDLYVWVSDDPAKADPESYRIGDAALEGAVGGDRHRAEPGACGRVRGERLRRATAIRRSGRSGPGPRPRAPSASPGPRTSRPTRRTAPRSSSPPPAARRDFNGADRAGEVYTMRLDFTHLACGRIGGTLDVLYDGDSDPGQLLRSPDNLDWADDGFVYVQEDPAAAGLFGEGAVNPAPPGIVRIDPAGGSASPHRRGRAGRDRPGRRGRRAGGGLGEFGHPRRLDPVRPSRRLPIPCGRPGAQPRQPGRPWRHHRTGGAPHRRAGWSRAGSSAS